MFRWPASEAFTLPLEKLKGLGPKTLARLNEAGFYCLGDLLGVLPKSYQDRRQLVPLAALQPGNFYQVSAKISQVKLGRPRGRGRRFIECILEDEGATLALSWFNSPSYLGKVLKKGLTVRAYGLVKENSRGLEMQHPDFELDSGEDLFEKVRPIYPALAQGEVSPGRVKNFLSQGLNFLALCPTLFPTAWLSENNLDDPVVSLHTLHCPPQEFKGPVPLPAETKAYKNLAFFELFFWRLLMLELRALQNSSLPRPQAAQGQALVKELIKILPYKLSPEQKRVSTEILKDLRAAKPMSRLLEGEVGGGKTLVAALAAFFTLGQNKQAAIMAPTEVLCRQHFEFFSPYAAALGLRSTLLVGSLSEKEKKLIREEIATGQVHLVIGSQALIRKQMQFHNLGLAIIDEQHRFGVKQRLALRRKNKDVDLLTMSATPIPRSLALVLYGDVDISSMKGRLPGRAEVTTFLFQAAEKEKAYTEFLAKIKEGGQGFVVSPRIGDLEFTGETADEDENKRPSLNDLQKELKARGAKSIGILHGALSAEEKLTVMENFRQGKTQILVATSIIEVGIDVPEASAMLIEGAEYFGLAALHQLRGRVGRGKRPGFCYLLAQKELTPLGAERLSALCRMSDGPALAELDLQLRGPGEGFGLRQSGWPLLSFAKIPQDLALAVKAQALAEKYFADPFPLPPSKNFSKVQSEEPHLLD